MASLLRIGGALVSCCAIVTCLTTADTAFAAEELTAFRCQPADVPGTGSFEDEHCEVEVAGTGNYETRALPAEVETGVEETATGDTTLAATVGGFAFDIVCHAMRSTSGKIENVPGPPMKVVGRKIVLHFTECKVITPEPTKCKVKEETIVSNALKSEATMATGQLTKVKYQPEVGTTFMTVVIEACGTKALNGSKTVSGAVTAEVPENALTHQTFTGSAGGELEFSGQSALFESTVHATVEGSGSTIALKTS
jgi:hypothetical protein